MSKKLFFDVVNSVKGGCGKSTFSVLLATYYSKIGMGSYIIDLDLCGSSLKDTYRGYVDLESCGYIDDYLWDVKALMESAVLKVGTENSGDCTYEVNMIMVNKRLGNEGDELELDLFEDAVFRMIEGIYDATDKEEVHIIFDMPPGYEKFAERIVSWLLMGTYSRLDGLKKGGTYLTYQVNLFMISLLFPPHMYANVGYFDAFFDSPFSGKQYSDRLGEYLTVYPVLNDVTDIGVNQNISRLVKMYELNYVNDLRNKIGQYNKTVIVQEAINIKHFDVFGQGDFDSNPFFEKADVLLEPDSEIDEIMRIVS